MCIWGTSILGLNIVPGNTWGTPYTITYVTFTQCVSRNMIHLMYMSVIAAILGVGCVHTCVSLLWRQTLMECVSIDYIETTDLHRCVSKWWRSVLRCLLCCLFLQATIYRDDFLAERRDREKMVDQISQLKIKLDTETSSLRLQVGRWRGRRRRGRG